MVQDLRPRSPFLIIGAGAAGLCAALAAKETGARTFIIRRRANPIRQLLKSFHVVRGLWSGGLPANMA
jgi:threonine dehydrogenase-like Zn-dependent dehydrogenase